MSSRSPPPAASASPTLPGAPPPAPQSNCWTTRSSAADDGTCSNTVAGCLVKGNVGAHAYARWPGGNAANTTTAKAAPPISAWSLAPLRTDRTAHQVAGGYSLGADVGGAAVTFSHREEPKMLLEWSEPEQGWVPTHLFNVVIDAQIPHWKLDVSYIHAQPIDRS